MAQQRIARNNGRPKAARPRGRPQLPKGKAKGHMVSVRLTARALRAVTTKAKASKQTVSQWIRNTLDSAIY